jgi:hypothetical protein
LAKYNYNDQDKENKMGWECNTKGEKRNACRILVEKPERKRPLGRTRLERYDGEVTEWIDVAQDQWRVLVNMVMNLRVP